MVETCWKLKPKTLQKLQTKIASEDKPASTITEPSPLSLPSNSGHVGLKPLLFCRLHQQHCSAPWRQAGSHFQPSWMTWKTLWKTVDGSWHLNISISAYIFSWALVMSKYVTRCVVFDAAENPKWTASRHLPDAALARVFKVSSSGRNFAMSKSWKSADANRQSPFIAFIKAFRTLSSMDSMVPSNMYKACSQRRASARGERVEPQLMASASRNFRLISCSSSIEKRQQSAEMLLKSCRSASNCTTLAWLSQGSLRHSMGGLIFGLPCACATSDLRTSHESTALKIVVELQWIRKTNKNDQFTRSLTARKLFYSDPSTPSTPAFAEAEPVTFSRVHHPCWCWSWWHPAWHDLIRHAMVMSGGARILRSLLWSQPQW